MYSKIEGEDIFRQRIGNYILTEINSDSGVRVVNLTTSKYLIDKSTMLAHYNIHKYT
jgi:hypothetical protein